MSTLGKWHGWGAFQYGLKNNIWVALWYEELSLNITRKKKKEIYVSNWCFFEG